MKKKILKSIIICSLSVIAILSNHVTSNASTIKSTPIEFSYLMTNDALISYSDVQPYGVYLLNGSSIINRMGTGKIGWGGATNAAIRCKVSITSMVERKTSTGWAFVTAYTQTNQNAFSAMISRSLYVSTGNQYRVRSTHYANTDVSTSFTDALVM